MIYDSLRSLTWEVMQIKQRNTTMLPALSPPRKLEKLAYLKGHVGKWHSSAMMLYQGLKAGMR